MGTKTPEANGTYGTPCKDGTVPPSCSSPVGGAGGTRTPYLRLAKAALSLMSYSPTLRSLYGPGLST